MATLTTSGREHDRAAARLTDAMEERARLAEIYERSIGTPHELQAYVHLREAGRRVSAYSRWLEWVDEEQ
jgi:aminoglycoside phosphotransferase (APT) family kinase protein